MWYELAEDGRTPVPMSEHTSEPSKDIGRRVGYDERRDGIRVSTVFLGLDHSFGNGPPVLWETMVFGADGDEQHCERYTSFEAAVTGHERNVEKYLGRNP
jgi:hypothetical protein